MKVLAIDTATPHIVAGLVDVVDGEARELAAVTHDGHNAHAEVLAPSIKSVLAQGQTGIDELDGVVVGLGPGPFTGLRVGVITALAIADAVGKPVWGVCSLDALSSDADHCVVVTDARRKEVYFARYEGKVRVGEPQVIKPDELPGVVPAGAQVRHAGADKYREVLAVIGSVVAAAPSPGRIVEVALRDGLVGGPTTPLTPIYIRRPDAAEPKQKPKLDTIGPTSA